MQIKASEIELSGINLTDCRYMTRKTDRAAGTSHQVIVESVSRFGIINPPLLSCESGKFFVVSGFRRIAAANELGFKSVLCHVLKASPFELFKIAVTENLFCGEFSELEKAEAVKKVSFFTGLKNPDEIAACISEIPGLNITSDYAARLLKLSCIPELVKKAVEKEILSSALALDVAGMQPSDYERLLFFFEHLRMGLNIQREFLNLVCEISKRDGENIGNILNIDIFHEILKKDVEVPQKRDSVIAALKSMRFPHIEKSKKNFSAALEKLAIKNSGILINPSKNLDSSEIAVNFSFSNKKGFEKILKILNSIGNNECFEELVSFRLKLR